MSRSCVVCHHEDMEIMDECLAGGDSPPTLTLRWPEVSSGSFRRHRDNGHIKFKQSMVAKQRSAELLATGLGNEAIVTELVLAYEISKHMMQEATNRGISGEIVALKAMKEATSTLVQIHKLTNNETAAVNDQSSEELADLARALSRVLPKHPEAREDLIVELEASGQYALADALRSAPGRAASGTETLERFERMGA